MDHHSKETLAIGAVFECLHNGVYILEIYSMLYVFHSMMICNHYCCLQCFTKITPSPKIHL